MSRQFSCLEEFLRENLPFLSFGDFLSQEADCVYCWKGEQYSPIKSFESREGKMSLSSVLLGDSGESSVFLCVHGGWR